ncbi:MAG: hypothetical protein ACRDKX_06115 [Solirubrobacterales bacterium]
MTRLDEGSTASLWRWLPAPHRRWIVVNALIVTALINTALNATIAWLSVRGEKQVPLWSIDETSTVTDTLGTLFLLPLITCVLCTSAVWRELRTGRLDRLRGLSQRQSLLAAMPGPRFPRGIAFGVLSLAALAAPATLLLVAMGLGDLSEGEFIAYKVSFAVALGAVVTPVIALRAMADRVGEPPRF